MLDEKWLGFHILTEDSSESFTGFLLESSATPNVLHLNFYSGNTTPKTVSMINISNLISLVSNGGTDAMRYLVGQLPPREYQDIFVSEKAQQSIIEGVIRTNTEAGSAT